MKFLFAFSVSLTITSSFFLNTQKGNAQGLHSNLTNHVDLLCYSSSLQAESRTRLEQQSLASYYRTQLIFTFFCFVLPVAVQQNFLSLVVLQLYSAGFVLAKLVMDFSVLPHNLRTAGFFRQHLPWHNYDLEYFAIFQLQKL